MRPSGFLLAFCCTALWAEGGWKLKLTRVHATAYEIYLTKYILVWKMTRAASGNNWNNVFWGLILFFFRIFEKKLISHKNCLQSDHLKLFIFEKNLSKKFDNKNGKKKCQNKKLKINFFSQKFLKKGHFEAKAYGESKKF